LISSIQEIDPKLRGKVLTELTSEVQARLEIEIKSLEAAFGQADKQAK
jgi:hypothetical protein